jgi:hypothetical protein
MNIRTRILSTCLKSARRRREINEHFEHGKMIEQPAAFSRIIHEDSVLTQATVVF